MPESTSIGQIFLSYAREDSSFAERLYRDLRAYGLDVWWDQESILPGKDWDREIRHAIESCGWFISIVSSRSVNKRGGPPKLHGHAARSRIPDAVLAVAYTLFVPRR